MAEYIEREAALAFLEKNHVTEEWLVNQYNADWIYSWLESRPTADVVEVVRCKDCRMGKPSPTFGEGWRFCKNNQQCHKESHFCGYGGRRNDGNEKIC